MTFAMRSPMRIILSSVLRGMRFIGVVPARDRLEELELRDDALAHRRRRLLVVLELRRAFAQRRERRVDLAALAAFHDRADDLPGVVLRAEEVAPVAEHVRDVHQVPGEQFLEPVLTLERAMPSVSPISSALSGFSER